MIATASTSALTRAITKSKVFREANPDLTQATAVASDRDRSRRGVRIGLHEGVLDFLWSDRAVVLHVGEFGWNGHGRTSFAHKLEVGAR